MIRTSTLATLIQDLAMRNNMGAMASTRDRRFRLVCLALLVCLSQPGYLWAEDIVNYHNHQAGQGFITSTTTQYILTPNTLFPSSAINQVTSVSYPNGAVDDHSDYLAFNGAIGTAIASAHVEYNINTFFGGFSVFSLGDYINGWGFISNGAPGQAATFEIKMTATFVTDAPTGYYNWLNESAAFTLPNTSDVGTLSMSGVWSSSIPGLSDAYTIPTIIENRDGTHFDGAGWRHDVVATGLPPDTRVVNETLSLTVDMIVTLQSGVQTSALSAHGATVPEPSSLVLFAFGAIAFVNSICHHQMRVASERQEV